MRIGAKVPNSGPLPVERGIATMAAELETVGFESLWVSDHIVMPRHIESRYPFAADGKPTWPSDTPYFDAMIALAVIATATQSASIGTAVLVLPLRHPVELAKQAASIDVLSGGRLVLGVGAGWLAEEFEALDVPFASRGQRFIEWVQILRSCWTGEPEPFQGQFYQLPEGVFSLPRPLREVPVLVGGHSPTAISRAATVGNGWLAHQSAAALDFEELRSGVEKMREMAKRSGKGRTRSGPPFASSTRPSARARSPGRSRVSERSESTRSWSTSTGALRARPRRRTAPFATGPAGDSTSAARRRVLGQRRPDRGHRRTQQFCRRPALGPGRPGRFLGERHLGHDRRAPSGAHLEPFNARLLRAQRRSGLCTRRRRANRRGGRRIAHNPEGLPLQPRGDRHLPRPEHAGV